MSIKRFIANADNTIVNTYDENLSTRATGSNTGQADVVEVYSIWERQSVSSSAATGSQELSRVLMSFPISQISASRASGSLPASGSVSFYLRVFEAEHSRTIPRNFKFVVQAVSQSWEEGDGLDITQYKDLTRNQVGSNWIRASKDAAWSSIGGTYHATPTYTQHFSGGIGDVEIDVSEMVEQWIAGTKENYGLGIRLSSSFEAFYSHSSGENAENMIHNPNGAKKSYYTKRFFARGTQYFFKRPCLEARWNSTTRDDRGNFYFSSSLAPAEDNLNTIYLYNYVRGRLRNIPSIGTGDIFVSLYSGSSDNTAPSGSKLRLYTGETAITGGYVSTGIYSCSVGLTKSADVTLDTLFDVWHDNSNTEFFTGSITTQQYKGNVHTREPVYFLNITNLKNSYMSNQNARFNLYVREKNWSPTIFTKANETAEHMVIPSASYRVIRTVDNLETIPHNTGSDFATGLSYDVSGSYFDFDMSLLQPGYEYAFKIAFYDDELLSWQEQNQQFNFRVEKYEH
ncbi:MAG: hypothetical protein CMF52_03365 [Legionellales bacterium]|nr:hypothetical protein [Legionellales bacterium]|tara:strand:+ start:1567 stop:3105 length:1539 start_codon:yes stop_codon:yes gene_type:complete